MLSQRVVTNQEHELHNFSRIFIKNLLYLVVTKISSNSLLTIKKILQKFSGFEHDPNSIVSRLSKFCNTINMVNDSKISDFVTRTLMYTSHV